ncbi:MAG: methylmalonyl Co-A mutase-associated GTPase MeaB [Rhodospirillales bacterium]
MLGSGLDSERQKLLDGVIAGETRQIARAISRAESGNEADRELLSELYARAGKAHVIGLTGVPGSGKSTLVRALTQRFRTSGRTVGIIAIDPSSPFSGGAILGDRVRMGELAGDAGVYIRSMATRGSLGGLTYGCLEAVDVLDAAGFDLILIETVGVGQDEVDIARAAHTVLVVSAPGLGDDIQAIKAGVLEIADIHVVSKCERPDANKTVADIRGMLKVGLTGRSGSGWETPVQPTSAETGEGIEELVELIDRHRDHMRTSGAIDRRNLEIAESRVIKAAEALARRRVAMAREKTLSTTLDRVAERRQDPLSAARELMDDTR